MAIGLWPYDETLSAFSRPTKTTNTTGDFKEPRGGLATVQAFGEFSLDGERIRLDHAI